MKKYSFENKQFNIDDYDEQKPFASFLPGVAGLNGIPMWVYYTNRGQGIAGFGLENKNGAILDFVPANVAYKRTELQGFRTFIKKDGKVHEIFSSASQDQYERRMIIEPNRVGFEEINHSLALKVTVFYFTTTNKPYAGLVRKVVLENLDQNSHDIELIDGLMTVWPYKNDDAMIKNMANLAVAWFEVYNLERNMPFFKNRSTTSDSAAVGTIDEGHFYGAFLKGHHSPLPVIIDTEILFGQHTGLLRATEFEKFSVSELLNQPQVSANKLSCAFMAFDGQLQNKLTFTSIIGKINSIESMQTLEKEMTDFYFESLENASIELGDSLTKDVTGKTAFPIFDAYVKQSFLDNLLRGGYPLVFKGKSEPIVYHVYSRIHGDMEREYNNFYIEPAFYSHGNGNFRDVNQNRRNDVYFVKEAGIFNIKQFMELLQIDGQNPLIIKGSQLRVSHEDLDVVLNLVTKNAQEVENVLMHRFTPGALMKTISDFDVKLSVSNEDFLNTVMSKATQENNAAYGHGFWVDHWTYNMDLVDNYLNVFPDKLKSLLYDGLYKSFQSPEVVLPRRDKYVITSDGKIRQYDAAYKDLQRIETLGLDVDGSNWQKTASGELYQTTLFSKLMILVVNKMTNFDPSGLGLMMNSDKPGWNDAMNGLPGLFGSSMNEVIEIRRVIKLLLCALKKFDTGCVLPEETANLMLEFSVILEGNLNKTLNESLFWEMTQTLKETYLESVAFNLSGNETTFDAMFLTNVLNSMDKKIECSIEKAKSLGNGIMPSYISHEAAKFEIIEGKTHPINGLANVKITQWSYRLLPLYLEAPARYLKQLKDKDEAKRMYDSIQNSGMYDEKLKMYVTSESLENESLEIGRARAFTPGWLERESNFMHMSYKYLLGMLKTGLYDEFFEAIKTSLPPFMDPSVYGRSTLENSSFIATSRNPNPSNHGRGFVSRLTGTTSEMISIWIQMMTGSKVFKFDDTLIFELKPVLPASFFDDNDEVRATLFGSIELVYTNKKRKNTFGHDGVSPATYTLIYADSREESLARVIAEPAYAIRNGEIVRIIVNLE